MLLEEYRFWRYSPDTKKRLERFYFYIATAAESATAPLFPVSLTVGRAYKTAVHLGPFLFAYWIWNRFDGWMLASTACLHLLVCFLLFLQCPLTRPRFQRQRLPRPQ